MYEGHGLVVIRQGNFLHVSNVDSSKVQENVRQSSDYHV